MIRLDTPRDVPDRWPFFSIGIKDGPAFTFRTGLPSHDTAAVSAYLKALNSARELGAREDDDRDDDAKRADLERASLLVEGAVGRLLAHAWVEHTHVLEALAAQRNPETAHKGIDAPYLTGRDVVSEFLDEGLSWTQVLRMAGHLFRSLQEAHRDEPDEEDNAEVRFFGKATGSGTS